MAEIWGAIVGVSSWIIGPVIALILGGNSIICRRAFEKGVTIGVFLFFKNFLATVVLASAAVISRIDRTPLGCAGVFRVLHLAILDVVSQLCSFTGLRYTSASFSSSLAACGPAFIFLAACFCGMEYVQWTARSFQAKVLGMTLMVGGGCIVGFYHGSTISVMHSPAGNHIGVDARELREDWFRGPLLILVALAASVWYNLQIKNVAAQYGSAIWLSFYITAAGTLMTLATALVLEVRSPFAWKIIADIRLVSYIYSGVAVSGLASFLQITLTRMRDPVFAAAFSPISLVFVMVMSLVALRDVIHLGSILGAISIIVGLFVLLWGKVHDPTPPVLPIQESASLPASHSSPASVEATTVGEADELSIVERGEQERRQQPEACQSQERPEIQHAELEVELPERPREAEVREQPELERLETQSERPREAEEREQPELERSETQSERPREAEMRELELPAPEQPAVDTSTQERMEVEESEQPGLPALEQPEVDESSETQLERPREAEQPAVDTSTQERIKVEESEQLEADESSETQLERPREAELREPEQPAVDTSTQERMKVEESEQPKADESSKTQLKQLREAELRELELPAQDSTQDRLEAEQPRPREPGIPTLEQPDGVESQERLEAEQPGLRESGLPAPEQPDEVDSMEERLEAEQAGPGESRLSTLEQPEELELEAEQSELAN